MTQQIHIHGMSNYEHFTGCEVHVHGMCNDPHFINCHVTHHGMVNNTNERTIYKDRIVYRDRVVEKIVEKIVEKPIYVEVEKSQPEVQHDPEVEELKDRIKALIYANHEQAKRIAELEKAKRIVIHEDRSPNRQELFEVCKRLHDILGDAISEEETGWYPWVDPRNRDMLNHLDKYTTL